MMHKPIHIKDLDLSFSHKTCFENFSCQISYGSRIAIQGDNGSGKTTLIKAILGDESVCKTGQWHVVKREDVGYLDQHYANLQRHCEPQRGEANQSFSGSRRFARDDVLTVLETIADLAPHWSHIEVRRHLNDFLFRKNEEVNALINTLSGGEKARLSLAQIGAKTPQLLILDEITNNLDRETKDHVIQVLKSYPGAMIVISHDADFLEEIGVNEVVNVGKFK
jgi:ATPase subunit of ABC transporter with duplicated ATPase domains